MKDHGLSTLFLILSPIFSGVFLFMALPDYDLGWLSWVALVPLLMAISEKGVKLAFFLAWIAGIIFIGGTFHWLYAIPGYTTLHHAIIIPLMGLYFGIFGLLFSLISRRRGPLFALCATPFLWVTLEYLRSHMSFLSLPWAFVGHAQYRYPLIIQFASITGAYGISFLVVLVNAALTAVVLVCFRRTRAYQLLTFLIGGAALLTALAMIHGHLMMREFAQKKTIRTSVLQGNIDRARKADPKRHAEYIMQQYTDLTRKAAKESPELIVWPEASTPGFVLKDMDLLNQVTSLIRNTKTHFLIGSSEYPKFVKAGAFDQKDIGNTALFFSPTGKVLGQYLKIQLVPFGEYVPFEGIIPWPRFIVPEGKKSFEVPGKEPTLFNIEGNKFGVLICWEVVFPELFRAFVKKGANFMINITNEGWFGKTAAPYQLAALSVFRAVENRVALARAANTGISCFINPLGQITGRVRSDGKDIFVEGHLTQGIQLTQEKTFYTIHGDIFAYTNIIIAILLIALSLFCRRKHEGSYGSP